MYRFSNTNTNLFKTTENLFDSIYIHLRIHRTQADTYIRYSPIFSDHSRLFSENSRMSGTGLRHSEKVTIISEIGQNIV